ncbi:MAG TPA: T9SS type A sorting domain-containing protein [Bacteroidia bacterium]|nr:T9SS type A sorting domain-containing protein [Bacteroidia bacterium]
MKTPAIIITFIAILISNTVNGQNRKPSNATIFPLKHPEYNKAVKVLPPVTGEIIIPLRQTIPLPSKYGNVNNATGIISIIGGTTYDLQSNGSMLNTVYKSGNNIGAAWTFSTDLSMSFPDRGTAVNFSSDNGATWQPQPSARIQPDKRGWGNLNNIGSGECIVSHKNGGDSLGFYYRPVQGAGPWIHTALIPPPGNFSLWPRMATGGAAGNSVHIISLTTPLSSSGSLFNGIDGAMTYTRSQDGGVTWNLTNILLPGIDSLHYFKMFADCYAIDVKGNTVAIVHAGLSNDWVLWKSTDDGTTWTKKTIEPFPISLYDEITMDTDLNSDGAGDTLETTDGSVEVLIGNNGMVHCWAGRMMVLEEPGAGVLSYFPATDGLLYWNESFLNYLPVVIAGVVDWDASGTIDIEPNLPFYQTGLTSMPSAGIDAVGNIYVAYSGMVEWTTNGVDQSYRNIYCVASPDNGYSWSIPVNLINDPFTEGVYPSLARDVDANNLHLTWQQDAEPGLAVVGDLDPLTYNEIVFDLEGTSGLFVGIHPVPPIYMSYAFGNGYYDLNQNGIMDGSDYGIPHQKIRLLPDSTYTFTNMSGNYNLGIDSGIYTVEYVPDINWQLTSDSASYTFYNDTSINITGLDFGVFPVNQVYDMISSLTGSIARCNSDVNYWINYENTGTAMIDSGTVTFVKDPQMTFVQSTPPYNLANGDTFIWNFYNLFPFQQGQINIVLHIGPPLTQGDTIHNCETVNYNDGITARTSNDCLTQVVVCSFDPNDKSVRPEGVGPQHYTLLADTMQYTIRFQNTGTDTAFVVRIKDTLDVSLDINSFRIIASSHPLQTTIQNNGAIEFLFDNILLADSNVNELASHGFVKYRVKAKPGTVDFTSVQNTAYIYFDYNLPVVTNTTLNTLVTALSVPEISSYNNQVKIYPNPFNESTQIIFENPGREKYTMKILDVTGRELRCIKEIVSDKILIRKENLSHGLYFIELINDNGKASYKGKIIVK